MAYMECLGYMTGVHQVGPKSHSTWPHRIRWSTPHWTVGPTTPQWAVNRPPVLRPFFPTATDFFEQGLEALTTLQSTFGHQLLGDGVSTRQGAATCLVRVQANLEFRWVDSVVATSSRKCRFDGLRSFIDIYRRCLGVSTWLG